CLRERVLAGALTRLVKPLLMLVGFYVMIVLLTTHSYSAVDTQATVFNQTAAALLFAVLIYMLLAASNPAALPASKIAGSKIFRVIGKYSYAIYVFHYPVIVFVGTHIQQWLMQAWRWPAMYAVVVAGLCVLGISF